MLGNIIDNLNKNVKHITEKINIIFMVVDLDSIRYGELLNNKINYIIYDKMLIEKHNSHFKDK